MNRSNVVSSPFWQMYVYMVCAFHYPLELTKACFPFNRTKSFIDWCLAQLHEIIFSPSYAASTAKRFEHVSMLRFSCVPCSSCGHASHSLILLQSRRPPPKAGGPRSLVRGGRSTHSLASRRCASLIARPKISRSALFLQRRTACHHNSPLPCSTKCASNAEMRCPGHYAHQFATNPTSSTVNSYRPTTALTSSICLGVKP